MSEAWIFTSELFHRYGISRYPYLLVHDILVDMPILNPLYTRWGCIRATPANATRVLDAGHPLLIYPGGGEELLRPTRDRTRLKFQNRTGYVRLALKYNVPIVPIAAVGGHSTAIILDDLPWLADALGVKRWGIKAWPLMLSLPWGLTLGPVIPPYIPWPAKVIVEVLDPIVFPHTGSEAAKDPAWISECAKRVETALETAMVRLEAERLAQPGLLHHVVDAAAHKWEQLVRRMKASVQVSAPGIKPVDISDLFPKGKKELKRTVAAGERKKFTEAQIRRIVKQSESGRHSVTELCRQHGMAKTTLYRWRSKYSTRLSA